MPKVLPMTNRYLSAYYFMSNNLCINRQHTRQDMLWMKAHHYDGIHIACDEQHFGLAGVAIRTIIEEAHDVGLDVFAIPSRWCGLIAGWPQGAGHFTASRPDVWMVKEDGSPMIKPFCGPLASVFHPDVQQHMVEMTQRMMHEHDFDGIIWDELKSLHETDFHPQALAVNNGHAPSRAQQIEQTLDIFAKCNQAAKVMKPDLTITSFLYAQLEDDIVKPWATTSGFDEIGLDGHTWRGSVFNHAPHENKSSMIMLLDLLILLEPTTNEALH